MEAVKRASEASNLKAVLRRCKAVYAQGPAAQYYYTSIQEDNDEVHALHIWRGTGEQDPPRACLVSVCTVVVGSGFVLTLGVM